MTKLIAIDPSSTRTGYAVMTDYDQVIEAGYFKPSKSKSDPRVRIREMAGDLRSTLIQHKPSVAVIEMPSGHVHRRLQDVNVSGLSVYGWAAGVLWWTLFHTTDTDLCDLRDPDQNQWTNGVKKPVRRAEIAFMFPQYAKVIKLDSGCDVADAIGLGQWWYRQQAIREVMST